MSYTPLNNSPLSEEEKRFPHSAWGEILQAYDDQTDKSYWMLKFDDSVRGDDVWEQVRNLSKLQDDSLVSAQAACPEFNAVITEERGDSLFSFIKTGNTASQKFVRRFLRKFLALFQRFEEERFVHGNVNPGMFFFPVGRRVPDDLDKLDEIPLKLYLSLGASWEGEVKQPFLAPKYCAPEMCNPEFGKISWRSDVYSLGMVALELLIGSKINKLFDPNELKVGEPEWLRVQGNFAGDELPSLSDKALKLNIPGGLADVLNRMLKRDPKERSKSAELIAILEDTEETDAEYRSDIEESSDSFGFGDDLPGDGVVITFTGTATGDGGFGDWDSDGDIATTEPPKERPSLLATVGKYLLKPYVLFPGSAAILVGILCLILSFMGAYNDLLYLPIDAAAGGDKSDLWRYARVYQLKKGDADTNYVREIPRRIVNGQPSWLLSTNALKCRLVADGYEPLVFTVESGKKGLDIKDSLDARIDLKSLRKEVKFLVEWDGVSDSAQKKECRVYRNVLESEDYNRVSLNQEYLDPWPEDSYRAGIYRKGFKPEAPKAFSAGWDVKLLAPADRVAVSLSQEDEDQAEEIYAMLCAVPCEWDRADAELKTEYERILGDYAAALDGGLELSSVKREFMLFFAEGVARTLTRSPLFLETSRQGLWRKTREAVKIVEDVEKKHPDVATPWSELEVLTAIASCQNALEKTCANYETRFFLNEDDEPLDAEDPEDPKVAYDNLRKVVENPGLKCSPEIRILAARIFARYALVKNILNPWQKRTEYSGKFVDGCRNLAKKQLKIVVDDEKVDAGLRTTANYLDLCLDFSRLKSGGRYGEGGAEASDYAKLAEPFEAFKSDDWDGSGDENDANQSDFKRFSDFKTASEIFETRDDPDSERRAACARLQRYGAKWMHWGLMPNVDPNFVFRNNEYASTKNAKGSVMELYDLLLSFCFSSKPAEVGAEEKIARAYQFGSKLNDVYQQTVPRSREPNSDPDNQTEGEGTAPTARFNMGDPGFLNQYFCEIDGEFMPTAQELIDVFRQAFSEVDQATRDKIADRIDYGFPTSAVDFENAVTLTSQKSRGRANDGVATQEGMDPGRFIVETILEGRTFQLYSPLITPLTTVPEYIKVLNLTR